MLPDRGPMNPLKSIILPNLRTINPVKSMVKHTSGCLAGLLEQVRGQNSVQVCPAGARPQKRSVVPLFSFTVRTAESLALLETKLAYSAPRPLGSRGLIWGF